MHSLRRSGAAFGALSLLVLSSCVDSNVVSPEVDASPSFAISDGSTGQTEDFYFLPPLADGNPNPVGEFNPFLRPTIRVCEIAEDELGLNPPGGKPTCTDQGHREILPAGALTASIDSGTEQYAISWDTDGPETARNINTDKFLLLEVLVGEQVQGWIDLDPQDPQGPGQSTFDAYAFRVGETIPVKFFLSTNVLCDPSDFVTECITGVAVNQEGANLSLDSEGNKLGLVIFQNSLPAPFEAVIVTVERIDPVLFADITGEECIPGGFGLGDEESFDAPQFGDCFRVTTVPELTASLLIPALVSICLDPASLAGINLTQEQQDQLTMVRFDDIDLEWEALADAAGDCPTTTASLLDVPDSGFMRYAAMGVNAVADFLGPQPLAARDIRLGGLTGSFSRFRYMLPGQMIPTDGDGVVLQAFDDDQVAATVNVVDHEGVAVENAVVHFSTTDGSVSATEATSDASGNATVTWTVDRSSAGDKTLTASALGLSASAVPEHDTNHPFTAESVTFTATVVGDPSSLAQNPAGPITDAVAGQPQPLSVTVTDAAGNLVEGTEVTWTCTPTCYFNGDPSTTLPDGSATVTDTTGADGVASVTWTPLTSGSQVSVASVGGPAADATFNATVAPAPAVEPTYPTAPATGTAGTTLTDPLVITVVDEFGNPRTGDQVTWTVGSASGSVSEASTLVDQDGNAQVTWTLDQAAGLNSLTVALAGTSFSTTLEVIGEPGPAVQPTGTGSGQTGVVDQALATPLSVTVADQFGNPISGETVVFSTADGGSFAPATVVTGADGVAATAWTLGTGAGAQAATATVGSFTVGFTATANPGAPASLSPTQSATAGLLGSSIDLGITVTDAFGNVRGGDAVTWTVTAGGGSFSAFDATTAADGTAAAAWTLGVVPGPNTATVASGGITRTLTVTAICVDGWGTASVNGAFDAGEWTCARSEGFTANISGGKTPATVYWMNDADNLYMAVRIQQSADAKVNDLRIDFDNDGDNVAAVNDDAIGHVSGSFIDEYLTQRCFDRSQAGCGGRDATVNGSSMAANNGTFTTFELSHPLSGDGSPQDFVRSAVAGQNSLGFFLSLQQGNGAQGNTQWPGFRDYRIIDIVGLPTP